MKNDIPYDLLIVDTEQNMLNLLSNSGLTISTISLIVDKVKTSIDIQKIETIKQMRIQEENKKQELEKEENPS